jgi:TctA family transporter
VFDAAHYFILSANLTFCSAVWRSGYEIIKNFLIAVLGLCLS